jgi:hypothetical protein
LKTANESKTPAFAQALTWPAIYALLAGLFLGLSLIKFGNPVILDYLLTQSSQDLAATNPGMRLFMGSDQSSSGDWMEELYRPWSYVGGIWLVVLLAALAFKNKDWKRQPPYWLWFLIIFWFFWQIMASFQTINVNLTKNTLAQFAACLGCLFIGWHGLPQTKAIRLFWPGIIAGLVVVLWRGFTQHHGGLEAMRNFIYEQPNWQQMAPELLKRVTGGRIFGTLVYPNALAGVILLLLPPTAVALWQYTRTMPNIIRGVCLGFYAYLGVSCLIWTGSKSGWLIALGVLVGGLVRVKTTKRVRGLIILVLCIAGLTGFFLRYAKYFERGATSVSARFDYWKAAWTTAKTHALLGTGPGTFMNSYKQLKAPESEMARLTHNDYLEQASDSGIPGCLSYTLFIIIGLSYLYRKSNVLNDPLRNATLLGVTAIFVQSLLEFGLYIPATSWSAFILFGWLLGTVPTGTQEIPAPKTAKGSVKR